MQKIHIGQALDVIENHYREILTVSEWAFAMGYSRAHFSRRFKDVYGLCPKYYLREFRFKILETEISRDPQAIGYKIAVNCGFTNEQSLQKYLRYNYDLTLNHFRERYAKNSSREDPIRLRKKNRDDEGDAATEVPC